MMRVLVHESSESMDSSIRGTVKMGGRRGVVSELELKASFVLEGTFGLVTMVMGDV